MAWQGWAGCPQEAATHSAPLAPLPQQSMTLRDMVKLSVRVQVCRPGGGEEQAGGGWEEGQRGG